MEEDTLKIELTTSECLLIARAMAHYQVAHIDDIVLTEAVAELGKKFEDTIVEQETGKRHLPLR